MLRSRLLLADKRSSSLWRQLGSEAKHITAFRAVEPPCTSAYTIAECLSASSKRYSVYTAGTVALCHAWSTLQLPDSWQNSGLQQHRTGKIKKPQHTIKNRSHQVAVAELTQSIGRADPPKSVAASGLTESSLKIHVHPQFNRNCFNIQHICGADPT